MPRKFDFVSPGVQITEIDESKIASPLREDGLLVIGRAPAGPALKPVKVDSLENFIDVFGKPISGKGTINDDVWRDGNNQGPTYAMYAAQAWLASNTSPVTFVRLLGEDAPTGEQASNYVKAGWNMGGASVARVPSSNTTAYGLFVMPSASQVDQHVYGTLGAIIYTSGAAVTLKGTPAAGKALAATSSAGQLIQSISTAGQPATFRLEVHNGALAAAASESLVFHFDPDQKDGYIRNVLNTNPQKIPGPNNPAAREKPYFLGQTYEESVYRRVTSVSSSAGKQWAMVLPLGSGSAAASNLTYNLQEATASATGWIINRNPTPDDNANFQAGKQKKLFRLVSLHEGEWFHKNYYVSIEDLVLGTVANPNSSFSIVVRDSSGNAVEQFSNLNLDESSVNFIGKKIGDMYQSWDNTNERYELYGDYQNMSDFVRVEMAADWKSGIDDAYKIPWGFYGPVRPKGFCIVSGTTAYTALAGHAYQYGTADEAFGAATRAGNLYVRGGADVSYNAAKFPSGQEFVHTPINNLTASFEFPRLKFTEQNTARAGSNYLKGDTFGLKHKKAVTNTNDVLSDRSYIDLLGHLGGGIDLHSVGEATEHSFIFSLDDINEDSGKFYWASGSHAAGAASNIAVSAGSGSQGLLDKGVKKFALPFFGGFDGVDITQVDPFSSVTVLANRSENSHYANYSIKKAIDSISDSEVVKYDVISVPGLTNEALSNELIAAVEERGDALAIVDLDDGFKETYENDGDKTGGSISSVLSTARSRDLNTSYAATYYPRIRLRDTLSGNGDVLIAPASVAAIGALAFSDANSIGPWFAPAGFNRGGLSTLGGSQGPRVVGTWKNLSKSDRDDLYELNINPVARFPAVGEGL